jgi:hypothetical protein
VDAAGDFRVLAIDQNQSKADENLLANFQFPDSAAVVWKKNE